MNTNNHIQTITRLLTTKMNVVATATATKSWHFIHYCLNMVRKYAFKNKLQLVLQAPFSIIVTHLSLSHLLWTLLTTLWFEKYLLYDCDALLSFIPYSIRKYYSFFQFLFSCLLALVHTRTHTLYSFKIFFLWMFMLWIQFIAHARKRISIASYDFHLCVWLYME